MHRLIPLALIAALGACSAGGETATGPAPGSISARFMPGDAVDIIQVTVNDRQAARAIELVGPNGVVQPAYTINTERAPSYSGSSGGWGFGPSVGFGFGGGSRGFGTGIGLSLPLGGYGTPAQTVTSDQTVSNAFIRIPDLNDYRQNWGAYAIRIRLGDPPDNVQLITIEAPPPAA